jgi:CRP-like cAMP-binding protein
VLATQGEPGASLYLVLDGVLAVAVDGKDLGEVGPGAVLGERAILESSPRTATLTARTQAKIAEAPAETINRPALTDLAQLHRREATDATL